MASGPKIKIHGIRQKVPQGYIVARIDSGSGDLQLIPIATIGHRLVSTGTVAGGFAGALSGLRDVDLSTAPTDGQVLEFDEATGKFKPVTISTSSSLATDTDVSITSPADGEILIFDGASAKWKNGAIPIFIQKDCVDETTALTVATVKTFRMPHAVALTEVRASLTTAQATNGAGGILTVDVKQNGTSIFSTLLTIDNTEKTSATAATPAVISASALLDDDEITIHVTQVGDGTAAGLKVTFIGTLSNASAPATDDDYAAWMAAA